MVKLYRFPYSCYALKIQHLLSSLGFEYQVIDIPYGDRAELAQVTGGRVVVPAVYIEGKVLVESRRIAEEVIAMKTNNLVPKGYEALIWGYADWCDSILEDVLVKITAPYIREMFATPFEKGLFTLVKERKFGEGCLQAWSQSRSELIEAASQLLKRSIQSIEVNGFIAGSSITYADITLSGHLAMVEYASSDLVENIHPALTCYMERLRSHM